MNAIYQIPRRRAFGRHEPCVFSSFSRRVSHNRRLLGVQERRITRDGWLPFIFGNSNPTTETTIPRALTSSHSRTAMFQRSKSDSMVQKRSDHSRFGRAIRAAPVVAFPPPSTASPDYSLSIRQTGVYPTVRANTTSTLRSQAPPD